MTQTGIRKARIKPMYLSYEQLHETLLQSNALKLKEYIITHTQTSPTSATPVEVQQAGGLTISQKGKTALTLKMASDTDDAAYDTKTVIGHYFTNAGVASTFTATFNAADSRTEVACCADFYCWNLRDYTPSTVIVCSVAVQAGDNVYIGTTGMVAGAELRYATIAAAATYPVVTTLFGVGDIYGLEETNTAGDVAKVITAIYINPWGKKYTGNFILAADTTTIVRLTDATSGYPVLDFYRLDEMKTTAITGKYVAIGVDADKVVGTVAIDTFYGVIEEANYHSIHSRIMAQIVTEAHYFLGRIEAMNSNPAKVLIVQVEYTPLGAIAAEIRKWEFMGSSIQKLEINEELEPLSEVTLKIADDAATPVVANLALRYCTVEV